MGKQFQMGRLDAGKYRYDVHVDAGQANEPVLCRPFITTPSPWLGADCAIAIGARVPVADADGRMVDSQSYLARATRLR